MNVVLKKEKEDLILVKRLFSICKSFVVSLLILNLRGHDFTSLNRHRTSGGIRTGDAPLHASMSELDPLK